MDCVICEKPLEKGQRVVAFGEVTLDDHDWQQLEESNEVDEVVPTENFWFLAHWEHFFKPEEKTEDEATMEKP